jgi:type II secretory pathway pseudopilin PulG
MMELVFVIVVVGILAAVLVPRMQDSRLREGADQIVSHIRYTQHLAMIDDKFDPADAVWYRKRWQILFEQNANNEWTYTIFSDTDTNGNPAADEIARNPQDTSKRLTGGSVLGGINSDNIIVTRALNIGREYGIRGANGVVFRDCQNDDALRIVFDYLGRPMSGNPSGYVRPYDSNNLITSIAPNLCTIIITDSSGDALEISIEPETGFARVDII